MEVIQKEKNGEIIPGRAQSAKQEGVGGNPEQHQAGPTCHRPQRDTRKEQLRPQVNPASPWNTAAPPGFTFQDDSEDDAQRLWAPWWFFAGTASACGVITGE